MSDKSNFCKVLGDISEYRAKAIDNLKREILKIEHERIKMKDTVTKKKINKLIRKNWKICLITTPNVIPDIAELYFFDPTLKFDSSQYKSCEDFDTFTDSLETIEFEKNITLFYSFDFHVNNISKYIDDLSHVEKLNLYD